MGGTPLMHMEDAGEIEVSDVLKAVMTLALQSLALGHDDRIVTTASRAAQVHKYPVKCSIMSARLINNVS